MILPWQWTLSGAAFLFDVLLEHVLEAEQQRRDGQAASHAALLLGGQTGRGLVVVQQRKLQQRLEADFGKLLSQLPLAVIILSQKSKFDISTKNLLFKRSIKIEYVNLIFEW